MSKIAEQLERLQPIASPDALALAQQYAGRLVPREAQGDLPGITQDFCDEHFATVVDRAITKGRLNRNGRVFEPDVASAIGELNGAR